METMGGGCVVLNFPGSNNLCGNRFTREKKPYVVIGITLLITVIKQKFIIRVMLATLF